MPEPAQHRQPVAIRLLRLEDHQFIAAHAEHVLGLGQRADALGVDADLSQSDRQLAAHRRARLDHQRTGRTAGHQRQPQVVVGLHQARRQSAGAIAHRQRFRRAIEHAEHVEAEGRQQQVVVAAAMVGPAADADHRQCLRHALQRASHLGAPLGGHVHQGDIEFAGAAVLRHLIAVVIVARVLDDDLQQALESRPKPEHRDPVDRARIERRSFVLSCCQAALRGCRIRLRYFIFCGGL